jgi:hypothetical protein
VIASQAMNSSRAAVMIRAIQFLRRSDGSDAKPTGPLYSSRIIQAS